MEITSSSGPSRTGRRSGRWAELKAVAEKMEPVDSSTDDGWLEFVVESRKVAKAAQSSLYAWQRQAKVAADGQLDWRFQIVLEDQDVNGKKVPQCKVFFRKLIGAPRDRSGKKKSPKPKSKAPASKKRSAKKKRTAKKPAAKGAA